MISPDVSSCEIIDSHIHLYAATHIPTLAWAPSLPDNHPLKRQQSVAEYRSATGVPPNLKGFIFLETDRQSHPTTPSSEYWKHPLNEIAFLFRIATGNPVQGEGHTTADASLVQAVVPWAPIAAGPEAVAEYVEIAESQCTEAHKDPSLWRRYVSGFRYLVQDKPAGTMNDLRFIDSLRWLGRNGYTFDLGVDARSGGLWQLQEACAMVEKIGDELPNVMINHLCKPNLRIPREELQDHEEFLNWKQCIFKLAGSQRMYMKLSGLFSEMKPQDPEKVASQDEIVNIVYPWVEVIFDAFGPERIIFGSDWPVCNVGGAGNGRAWKNWKYVVERLMERRNLAAQEKAMVWAGTARRAYGIG